MTRAVEICVESAPGAVAAWRGGADRIELCEDRGCGGVTPGAAEVASACQGSGVPVHVLIRPRAGGFVYSEAEVGRMRDGVREAKARGASGVVLGLLRADGAVDRDRTAALVAEARPLSVTFHKAFDAARDPFEALDVLADLGVDRVLTSGQAPTAREGLACLAGLVRRASGRVVVMAGGSVTEADLPALAAAGVREVHVGSAALADGRTDPDRVRRLVAAWAEVSPL